jgi:hypothetical protein
MWYPGSREKQDPQVYHYNGTTTNMYKKLEWWYIQIQWIYPTALVIRFMINKSFWCRNIFYHGDVLLIIGTGGWCDDFWRNEKRVGGKFLSLPWFSPLELIWRCRLDDC